MNSPSGFIANHRDIIFDKYMSLYVILMHLKYKVNMTYSLEMEAFFTFHTYVKYIRCNVQRKAKFCTLLSLYTLQITPNTSGSVIYIQIVQPYLSFMISLAHFIHNTFYMS